MQVEMSQLEAKLRYKLLTGLIVPRPIAWISTIGKDGIPNLAPFSFFNAVCHEPPTVSISIMHEPNRKDNHKDTLQNILKSGEFVVNLVDESLVVEMNITATDYPSGINEFKEAGLNTASCLLVNVPRIAEAAASLECRLSGLIPIGTPQSGSSLVLGEVLAVHVKDAIVSENLRVDIQKYRPVGRLAGSDYSYVHETFALDRGYFDAATGKVVVPKQS